MTQPDTAATCLISTRSQHRIATVHIRSPLFIWVRCGTKTLIHPQGAQACLAGQALAIAQCTEWDVINDPAPHSRYEALVLQFGRTALADFHERYGHDFSLRPLQDCAAIDMPAALADSASLTARTLMDAAASDRLKHHRALDVLLLLAEHGIVFEPLQAIAWEEKIRRLIGQRLHADWSVPTLAEAFHVSASTLRRKLAQERVSVSSLVREVRLESALLMLQTSALPVGEVAQRCGYESHSRFTAAFKSRFGFLPSVLRAEPALEPASMSA